MNKARSGAGRALEEAGKTANITHMRFEHRAKAFLLLLSDIFVLYLSLFLMLLLRYHADLQDPIVKQHFLPFSLVFILWLLSFYVVGLYDLRLLRNGIRLLKMMGAAIGAGIFLSVLFFYLVPLAGITPKTNLAIFVVIFAILELPIRQLIISRIGVKEARVNMILVGGKEIAGRVAAAVESNPQLGYEVSGIFSEDAEIGGIIGAMRESRADLLVVPRRLLADSPAREELYQLLASGATVYTLADFCEMVFQFIPLNDLDEGWFIEHSIGEDKFYDRLKRFIELILASALFLILLPLMALAALLVIITSSGPALFTQPRTGLNWREFVILKFRTMRNNAAGPNWTLENDPRITGLGKLLRHTHLDELPQLINVIKGEVSFVGPRPERPELSGLYDRDVPYYHIRQRVLPGITGWAQINYRPSASVEDAAVKFEYDLYYLKNRSLMLDLSILFRTIKNVFTTSINA